MNTENEPKLDPIQAQMLLNEMRKDRAKRRPTTPYVRIRRPWLGDVNWARHKEKLARKRHRQNRQARKTRRAQRRASRA